MKETGILVVDTFGSFYAIEVIRPLCVCVFVYKFKGKNLENK